MHIFSVAKPIFFAGFFLDQIGYEQSFNNRFRIRNIDEYLAEPCDFQNVLFNIQLSFHAADKSV